MKNDDFFVKIPVFSVLFICFLLLISACSSFREPEIKNSNDEKAGIGSMKTGAADTSESHKNESSPEFEVSVSNDIGEYTDDHSMEETDGTPKLSPNKVREAEEYAVTEPTEEQSHVISVYRQLYPECRDSKPLCYPLYNEGEIFFVPEEWFYAYYPAVTGKTVFYQIDNYNVCAFIQTIGEKGTFRFGVFDENYTLMSEVLSGIPLFEGKIWPHKIIERNEMRYLIVEYYYGWQGIRNSETVIYSLPSMEIVWRDSEIFSNDPDSKYDQFRFAINGDSFDVYDFIYHNGWMEESFKTSIEISEIDLP